MSSLPASRGFWIDAAPNENARKKLPGVLVTKLLDPAKQFDGPPLNRLVRSLIQQSQGTTRAMPFSPNHGACLSATYGPEAAAPRLRDCKSDETARLGRRFRRTGGFYPQPVVIVQHLNGIWPNWEI